MPVVRPVTMPAICRTGEITDRCTTSVVSSTRSMVRVTRSSARMICKRVRSTVSLTVASKRSTCDLMDVEAASRLSVMASTFVRESTTIACVDSRIGAVFLCRSVTIASMRAEVLRTLTKSATSTPAWIRTAKLVIAIQIFNCSISRQAYRKLRLALGFLAIGLHAGFVSSLELLFLRRQHFLAAFAVLTDLLARLATLGHDEVAAFFGSIYQRLPRLASRFWSVQNAH